MVKCVRAHTHTMLTRTFELAEIQPQTTIWVNMHCVQLYGIKGLIQEYV